MNNTQLAKNKKNSYFSKLPILQAKKTKDVSFIIFTLLALIFFGLFVIQPTITTILELQNDIEEKLTIDQQLTSKLSDLELLAKKYSELKNDLPIVKAAIPERPETISLTGSLQSLFALSLVTQNTFVIDDVDLSKTLTGQQTLQDTPYNFPFEFSATGSYASIVTFLNKLTNFNRVIGITNISLRSRANDVNQPTATINELELRVKGITYFKN